MVDNEIPNNGIDDNGNGFIDENLSWGDGSIDSWTGPSIGDGIDNPSPPGPTALGRLRHLRRLPVHRPGRK